MKKLLTIFTVLFLISFAAFSQSMTFRTYQIVIEYDDEIESIDNNSVIIFLDISSDKRSLHITSGLSYYIVDDGKLVREGIDEDGDEYEIMRFRAIDSERDKCYLAIKRWPSLKYMHFYIQYTNIEISYLTTRID